MISMTRWYSTEHVFIREKVKCRITRVDDFTRRTSVARDVRKRKSFYLDFFLLVLTLPFVRSHREIEFRLDIVHICKGAQETGKLKSVSVTDKLHARENYARRNWLVRASTLRTPFLIHDCRQLFVTCRSYG